jgi:Kef-type K+ transport system membrane component KefB
MSPTMQLLFALIVIIAAAKIGGYISSRAGQPSVLGELLAGLILGPSVVDFLHLSMFTDEHLGETVHHLAEIGVLLLMFIAGLGLHLSDLAKSRKVSVLAGTLGVVAPIIMGFGAARIFDFANETALFIGLVLAATSVSISAQTLMELRVLRSRVGISLLGAAVFDDILVVLGLSIFVAVTAGNAVTTGLGDILLIVLQMGTFLIVASLLGFWLLPTRMTRQIDRLPISEGLTAYAFVALLLYSLAAEVFGNMAGITGAFLAGLIFARSPLKGRIETGISTLAYGVFVPIFFINIGLSTNLRELRTDSALFLGVLVMVAIVSKIAGAGLGGRFGGLTGREALQLGVGMMSRGEVGLIVATVGVDSGIIDKEVFAVLVGIVIVTTLLTPLLLRGLFTYSLDDTQSDEKKSVGEMS